MRQATLLLATQSADDQASILETLQSFALRNSAVIAGDAEEALAFLQDENQPVPALMLLDSALGLKVLETMRAEERTRHVPVIVLSASSKADEVQRAYASGANSFIRKPSSRMQFGDALSQVIRYWLFLNQPG